MTTFLRLPRLFLSSRLLLFVLLALLLCIVPNVPVARATATGARLYVPSSLTVGGKVTKSNLDGTSPAKLTILQNRPGLQ